MLNIFLNFGRFESHFLINLFLIKRCVLIHALCSGTVELEVNSFLLNGVLSELESDITC